jgi:hypothetical protein
VVSRWLPTAAARVRVLAVFAFVVDKAALGQVFSEYFGFPCQSFHQIFYIIITTRGWDNRPLGGRSVEWTQLDPPPLYQLKKEKISLWMLAMKLSTFQFGNNSDILIILRQQTRKLLRLRIYFCLYCLKLQISLAVELWPQRGFFFHYSCQNSNSEKMHQYF